MANRLKMAKRDAILTLHRRQWSIRRIAKELGIHRDTVARHIQRIEAGAKPARAPLGVLDDPPSAESLTKIGVPEGKLGHPAGGRSRLKLGQAPIGSEALSEVAQAETTAAATPTVHPICLTRSLHASRIGRHCFRRALMCRASVRGAARGVVVPMRRFGHDAVPSPTPAHRRPT